MQNLRDKLLKAGKVNKKQRRRAEHQQRQKKRKGKAAAPQETEAKRKELYEAKLREQRERDQALEAERNHQRMLKERDLRVRYVVDHYAVTRKRRSRNHRNRWFYMARDHKIFHMDLTDEEAAGLEYGRHAIVERPGGKGDNAFAIVERHAADLIWDIDDAYVRFYNRRGDRPNRWWEHGKDPA